MLAHGIDVRSSRLFPSQVFIRNKSPHRTAANVVRLKDGILVEHWDVIQDEATEQQSKSGNPMFGDSFPR